jgi:hypothetical protein
MGAILTWAMENEEPPRDGHPVILRKEKRAQLRTARHRVWRTMGPGSLDATITMLILENSAYPEVDPGVNWMQQAVTWIHHRGWTNQSEAEMLHDAERNLKLMRLKGNNRDGSRDWSTVLDMGEGWGSIGTAAKEIGYATIGVDVAGALYQGSLHGHIRARVHMDFAAPLQRNLIQRVAKKAGVTVNSIMVVWLSPECTLLSRANHMNKSRGCAHGLLAEGGNSSFN